MSKYRIPSLVVKGISEIQSSLALSQILRRFENKHNAYKENYLICSQN